MFLRVKEAAQVLQMDLHQVYYLLMMGEIEAVKIGKAWRMAIEVVNEYAEQHPERKNKDLPGYFVYPGNSGNLFSCILDYLPPDTCRETSGMERQRGQLVHRAQRPVKLLFQKLKSLAQLELFTA